MEGTPLPCCGSNSKVGHSADCPTRMTPSAPNANARIAALESQLAAERHEKHAALYRERSRRDELERQLRECKSRADQDRADAERIDGLRKLCGYIEEGGGDFVKIGQDDATGDWIISVGSPRPGRVRGYGKSIRAAIDAARATQKESEKEKRNG